MADCYLFGHQHSHIFLREQTQTRSSPTELAAKTRPLSGLPSRSGMNQENGELSNSRYKQFPVERQKQLQAYWANLVTQRNEVDDALLGTFDIALIFTAADENNDG
jgi:hypothetical protein